MAVMRPDRWLTVAGCGTWLVSGLPTIFAMADGRVHGWAAIVWVIAFVAFGLAFGLMCAAPHGWLVRVGLLLVQTVAGLTMIGAASDVFPAATLVVVAGQLDDVSSRLAAFWLAAQTVAMAVIMLSIAPVVVALTIAGSFAGFQIFALTTAT